MRNNVDDNEALEDRGLLSRAQVVEDFCLGGNLKELEAGISLETKRLTSLVIDDYGSVRLNRRHIAEQVVEESNAVGGGHGEQEAGSRVDQNEADKRTELNTRSNSTNLNQDYDTDDEEREDSDEEDSDEEDDDRDDDEEDEDHWRCQSLSQCDLYRVLGPQAQASNSGAATLPASQRCMVYVTDLDRWSAIALLCTFPDYATEAMRSFLYKHITFDAAIEAKRLVSNIEIPMEA
jgi:hypothetical protein